MKCVGCGFENPQANKFCGGCGSPLAGVCRQCGFANPEGFGFCGQCGGSLKDAAAEPAAALAAGGEAAERRFLTIVFCDLVDSTPLAARLDPEDFRALVLEYQAVAGRAVERYAGHVAQYLGDGLLVYFGYPTAHEDDARRALYSALEILEAMRELSQRTRSRWDAELGVRIGIHSGSVVAGEVGTQQRSERLAVGQAPNIAARLQSIAGRNEVLLSKDTADIVSGTFQLEDLGPQTLKGVSEKTQVFRLVGETDIRDRFRSAVAGEIHPFVGREHEIGIIRDLLGRVASGAGEVLLVQGEPGIGKSRLIEQVREEVGDRSQWLSLACSPYHTDSAMFPLAVYFGRLFGFRPVDNAAVRLEKVEAYLDQAGIDRAGVVPFLAPILSLQPGEGYADLPRSAKQVKDRTFAMLDRLLFGGAGTNLTVLLIEDIHWADPSTRELIDYLVLLAPSRSVLLVATSRARHDEWSAFSHVVSIVLKPLNRAEVIALVDGLAGDATVPAWIRQEVEARTDGVPIFVEELFKMMLKGGETLSKERSSGGIQAIPSTLQESLTARLDSLGEARDTLQRASVLGREFSYGLLKQISPDSEAGLAQHLHQLLRDQLLVSVSNAQQTRFRFRHALIHDAAYETMLRSRRMQLHGDVADALSKMFPELIERRPELYANHLTRASKLEQALPYWLRAGQFAARGNALQEAANLFQRGLSLLPEIERTKTSMQIEQRLEVGLGSAIANRWHWGRPEVGRAFEKAQALSAELGDEVSRFRCMLSLRMSYTSQGRHAEAAEQGSKALALAESWDDPRALAQARAAMVYPHYHRGEFDQAVAHADAGFAALERIEENRFVLQQKLYLWAYMGESVCITGQLARARQIFLDGRALTGKVDDPYAVSFFLVRGALPLAYLRDLEMLEASVTEGMRIADEHGFGSIYMLGEILQGWLLARQTDAASGMELIADRIPRYVGLGSGADKPFCYLVLADAQMSGARFDDALQSIEKALAAVDQAQEKCHYAEALRLKGEVLAKLGSTDEALRALQASLQVARGQNALAWELRSAYSHARLLVRVGDRAEAARTLTDVLARLAEDNETIADVADARRLLGELAGALE